MIGEDPISLREELSRWTQAFEQKHGDMNLEVLDGHSNVKQIADAILASPFLAEKRLVVVKDFQNEQKAEAKKELRDILDQLPDSTILILSESSSPDKRSTLYKFLINEATLKHFKKPEGPALSQWILARVKKYGGQMDLTLAHQLAATVGDNLWQLDNEIQKLCLHAAGQSISKESLETLVQGTLNLNIFEMTDRLARKDKAGTLKLFRQLHEQGQEAPYLFAMIVRQFRLMLEMKALHEQGVHPKSIASAMAVHPFVVSKTLEHCRNFSELQLRSALTSLLDLDRRLKTGKLHFKAREEDMYLLGMERILLAP